VRIVDEALANIQRHADATTVRVSATKAGDQLLLTVIDNGRGFVPEHAHRGHGITGMLERAELLGGRLAIHSALGEGTQVRLFAPMASDDVD
jgi:signal transduction histidine kinase